MAAYGVPATARVRKCRSVDQGMQEEGMGHIQNAGWVAGDANSPAVLQKTASGWSSGLQMLLVQQPGWLIHGCKAMEAEAWTHPTGREHDMPRQSFE